MKLEYCVDHLPNMLLLPQSLYAAISNLYIIMYLEKIFRVWQEINGKLIKQESSSC